MPFVKGQSGNPAGRKPNENRIRLEKALVKAGKENNKDFLEHVAEQAFKDNSMAKEVLKKLIPDLSSIDASMVGEMRHKLEVLVIGSKVNETKDIPDRKARKSK